MNIILVEHHEITADTITLRDRRAEHISRILKSRPGDLLRAGIIDGPMGSAQVLAVARREVTIRLDCRQEPPAKAATALILAIPRPIMLKRVLAQAAAMGVQRIMLINARRVEKSFFHSSQLSPAGIRAALLQGLEQAGDTRLPEVTLHPRFRPFIEDQLPPPRPNGPLRLLAHPTKKPVEMATASLRQSETGPDDPLPAGNLRGAAPAAVPARRQMLAIGPEGGWVDFEINCFAKQGFTPFSWGPRILRVDTAVPVLLALAEAL
ncbi:16S rRNA (uracil(1498)-N(3))-methyltransferase [Desulfurivibrio alkaliphilus]|uniref:Ribosomal RNA small subunit methyltransferase E n=1 Tax=Desulfurivibrio alkaliphilus (strain DSM 19089 / UNIQEM U267 / AHT2) TaxID=589865 RepID=D6Z2K1_DESAT|nr:16S rRNA (uracil(1498)-N(3))-methyltransferase [Desulfurivibrio alkaliphilus]ADH85776.1 protein of unknown function DUF558 [Desulfurivibrio alkaliphilus AHT 2]